VKKTSGARLSYHYENGTIALERVSEHLKASIMFKMQASTGWGTGGFDF